MCGIAPATARATEAAQEESTYHTKLPKDLAIALISTRRAHGAADYLPQNVTKVYTLSEMMNQMKSSLDELSCNHLVVIEAPSDATGNFEHDLYKLVCRVREAGPEVAIIV